MPDVKTLYDEDFVAWSEEQAEALRATARGGTNQKLDWENLAEEIESLGRSERRELRSRISVIIEHLVKLGHSPAPDPRNDWQDTILRERAEIEALLEDSPSLRREVPELIKKATRHGVEAAARELQKRAELGQPLQEVLKSKAYFDLFDYTPAQILGDWFPPEPKG
jgi:hypothetical protein